MKKILVCLLGLVMSASAAYAQKSQFYFSPTVGYALGTPREVIGFKADNTGAATANIYGSYGNGANLRLMAGWNLTENFGFEIGGNYLQMNKTTNSEGQFGKGTLRGGVFSVMNAAVVRGAIGSLRVYAKGGFVIPLGATLKSENTISGVFFGLSGSVNFKSDTKTNIGLGYHGAVGLEIPMSDKFDFFFELNTISLRLKTKETTITELSAQGVNIIDRLSPAERVVKASDSINPNADGVTLAEKLPFNSVGLNFGLKINL